MVAPRTPDVSVVVPTHNRVQYLKQAIASCFEDNASVDVEVIVVNDGSSDGTRSYLDELEHPHVRPIHQSPQGAQAARNAGMKAAGGRYIKFLDDDDWLLPGSLAAEVDRLEESGADVSHGRIQVQEESANGFAPVGIAPESMGKDMAATILREEVWTVPHKYLFRRDAIQQCTWDPDLPYHQDYAFLIEIACRGAEFAALNRVVGVSRRHDGPRIADTKTAASPVDYYTLKVNLIKRGVRLLKESSLMESHHRRAAAEGIWTWAHIVAAFDLSTFSRFWEEIEHLAPNFSPERSHPLLRVLDSLIGVRGTEYVLYPLRLTKRAHAERDPT